MTLLKDRGVITQTEYDAWYLRNFSALRRGLMRYQKSQSPWKLVFWVVLLVASLILGGIVGAY
jgi:hypothetical protein